MTETEANAMAREWIESRVKASQDSEWKEALFSREAVAALIISVDASARKDGFHEGWREAMRPSG